MKKPKIVWNKSAVNQFEKAIEYIHESSPQNALKIKADISVLIDSLIEHPEKHPPTEIKQIITKVNSELLKSIGCESVILFQIMKL